MVELLLLSSFGSKHSGHPDLASTKHFVAQRTAVQWTFTLSFKHFSINPESESSTNDRATFKVT